MKLPAATVFGRRQGRSTSERCVDLSSPGSGEDLRVKGLLVSSGELVEFAVFLFVVLRRNIAL